MIAAPADEYDQLLAAAAEGDSAALADVSLAELSVILGPISGAPQVDPDLVPSGGGTMALARLLTYNDLMSDEQREEVSSLLTDLDEKSTVVHSSEDDPEYAAAHQAAIDEGLTEPEGFAGHGLAGHGAVESGSAGQGLAGIGVVS